MQRTMKSNTRTSRPRPSGRGGRPQKRTPYCKVCHDAGKTKQEYTSHYVKDKPGPEGNVVCPYLLSLTCRYCHHSGHTPNHCPEVKAKEHRSHGDHHHHHRRSERQQEQSEDGWSSVKTPRRSRARRQDTRAPRKVEQPKLGCQRLDPRNLFAELAIANIKKEEQHAIEKAAFPTLRSKKKAVDGEDSDISDISDSEGEYVRPKPQLTGWSDVAKKPVAESIPESAPVMATVAPLRRSTYDKSLSWADMCESDYESEDDYEFTRRDTKTAGRCESNTVMFTPLHRAPLTRTDTLTRRDAWDSEDEDHEWDRVSVGIGYQDDYAYADEDCHDEWAYEEE